MNEEYVFNLDKEMQTYDEAYFGKDKDLLEMEKCIAQMKKDTPNPYFIKQADVCNSPAFKKFCSLIEHKFGFTSVSIMIDTYSDEKKINAFTIPINGNFGAFYPVEDAIVNKYGIKYKKEMNYSIMIWVSVYFLFGSKFTPGEVLAILLHEIGHNFTYVLNTHLVPLNIINTVYRWTMILKYNPNKLNALLRITLGSTKWGIQLMHWIVKYRSFPIVDAFVNLGSILLGARRLWLDIINRIEEPLKNIDYIKYMARVFSGNDPFISPSLYYNPYAIATSTFIGYHDESFADRFVAMHGYGEELSSGLLKCSKDIMMGDKLSTKYYLTKLPIVGHLYVLSLLSIRFLLSPNDPHPQDIARAKSLATMLEKDLNNPAISDKLKKQIRKDLVNINKVIDEYSEVKSDDSAGMQAYALFNKLLLSILPDGDYRNILDKYIYKSNDRINNAIYNKIK